MASRPWYRRFPSDFIAAVQALDALERGVYNSLLDNLYARWRPLEYNPRVLAKMCGCSTKQFNITLARLADLEFLTVRDGFVSNTRFEQEREIASKEAQESRENGAKGGQKSAEKRRADKQNNHLTQATPTEKTEPLEARVYKLEAVAATSSDVPFAPQDAGDIDRSKFPRRNAAPHLWACLAERFSLDDHGVSRPVVASRHLDVVCQAVCEAARISDPAWRGDWDAVTRWLHAGIRSDTILAVIEEMAKRKGYKPPAVLRYFDRPVRAYHAECPGGPTKKAA